MSARRPPLLLGRGRERELLDRMLRNVREGQSAVLVVRGEPGVGKTALLRYAARQATGFRVVEVPGIEAEMELPFAGLHQLCIPLRDHFGALPEPQRLALEVALGLSAGAAADRFLLGLAVLSLLSSVAEERPLLCLVDDAQWLDAASAAVLGFVGRRLLAESVGLVFAIRESSPAPDFAGLPDLAVSGLDEQDARELLARVLPVPLDERVRDRIVAETAGNPLALLELPQTMNDADLATGIELPASEELPGHLEDLYLRRVGELPPETQRLLLLAAADPLGDATLVLRAAAQLHIAVDTFAPTDAGDLVEIGSRVRFRHPLVRSAVYGAASHQDRRAAHAALAAAIDPVADPDRRAWHRALAASGRDEKVAAELEHSAGRAQLRGGLTAAAAFLERAAELTPDPAERARRALAAAEAKQIAGSREVAMRLLAQAEAGPLDALQRARAHLLRGQAAFASARGREAPGLLLAAARELEPLDPLLARDTYLDALSAGLYVGRMADGVGVVQVAEAARAAPPSSERPQDVLLDGLAITISEGHAAGAATLKRAIHLFLTEQLPAGLAIRWLWLATHAAHDVYDDEGWDRLCTRHVELSREAGALMVLPLALSARIGLHLFAGELTEAAALNEEIADIAAATGSGLPPYGLLAFAAFRGRPDEAEPLIASAREEIERRGEGMGLGLVEHAAAVLYNGLGRYPEASAAAERGAAYPQELAFSTWSLPQLVEAAARSGQPGLAADAFERLLRVTGPSGSDWARGLEVRCRALVSEQPERHYKDAIAHLTRTRVAGDRARAHLLYGEWLRAEERVRDARGHLRTAHELFLEMGMEAFAERARRELQGAGETVRKLSAEPQDQLTPQQAQIARLARSGLTNAEIGGRLFLSPRTVEWHLRKVFVKLAISSRAELGDVLPEVTAAR
jgi:DNA-binding CsgD family transcriptional regulator